MATAKELAMTYIMDPRTAFEDLDAVIGLSALAYVWDRQDPFGEIYATINPDAATSARVFIEDFCLAIAEGVKLLSDPFQVVDREALRTLCQVIERDELFGGIGEPGQILALNPRWSPAFSLLLESRLKFQSAVLAELNKRANPGQAVASLALQFDRDLSTAVREFQGIIDSFVAIVGSDPLTDKDYFRLSYQDGFRDELNWYVGRLTNFYKAVGLVAKKNPDVFTSVDIQRMVWFSKQLTDRWNIDWSGVYATYREVVTMCHDLTATEIYERSSVEFPTINNDSQIGDVVEAIVEVPDAILTAEGIAESTSGSDTDAAVSDGPDELRLTLTLNGEEVGPFTPTEFDVVKLMWEYRERLWPASDAFFRFHQKFKWSQSADSPFGKHQTAIKTRFREQGLELPWRRERGSFKWLGWIRIRDGKGP